VGWWWVGEGRGRETPNLVSVEGLIVAAGRVLVPYAVGQQHRGAAPPHLTCAHGRRPRTVKSALVG
jgi:hypothetical protein